MSLRSQATIKAFADRVGIAPGIVVGRLQRDEIIGYNVGHALFETYGFVD